jgi:myo-inositol-1(or 4)-monophosphatase
MSKVKETSIEAGKIQKKYFRNKSLKIDSKSSIVDLVTEADKKSEELILNFIKKEYPDHAILSEESGKHDKESDYLWIVDPLDGTNNFAHGLPIFSISIALQYKGDTVLGVVYLPILDEMFSTIKGEGAFLNGTQITVTEKPELNHAVVASGFPYDKATHKANNISYISAIIPQLRGFRRMGSAAIDLAYVAAGFLDGYWEMNLNSWDAAAGELLVKEAKGKVVYFRDDRNISLIAAGKKIASRLHEEIKIIDSK